MLGSHILKNTSIIIGLLILVFIMQVSGVIDTRYFCLSPNESNWWRIFSAPLLHGSVGHIVGNITALMVTLPILFAVYPRAAWMVVVCGYILPMVFVCITGVTAYGLGISGLVYCAIYFLIFAGLRSESIIKFLIAMGALIMYAGSLVGATPAVGPGIGWTAHLGGIIVALALSILIDSKRVKIRYIKF